jgi:hypothetical protein
MRCTFTFNLIFIITIVLLHQVKGQSSKNKKQNQTKSFMTHQPAKSLKSPNKTPKSAVIVKGTPAPSVVEIKKRLLKVCVITHMISMFGYNLFVYTVVCGLL